MNDNLFISEHVSYYEVTKSLTAIRNGIDNTPTPEQLLNIIDLADHVIEPLRKRLGGKPIYFASFFRCDQLNLLIGGAKDSQHKAEKGAAVDIDQDGHTGCDDNRIIFECLKHYIPFDQLIWEFGDDNKPAWVHVSFNAQNNRGEILRATRLKNGKTKYTRI